MQELKNLYLRYEVEKKCASLNTDKIIEELKRLASTGQKAAYCEYYCQSGRIMIGSVLVSTIEGGFDISVSDELRNRIHAVIPFSNKKYSEWKWIE